MPKNTFKSFLWVVDSLRRRPMTFDELRSSYDNCTANTDHRELQTKTFFNWRNQIYDIFGIEIKYVNGKYEITDSDEPEREAALNWLVQSLGVNSALQESKQLKGRILLESIPSGEHHLTTLIGAMTQGLAVSFEYCRFGDGIYNEVVVEPYCLKMNNRRWYLLCRVPDSDSRHPDYPAYDRFGCIRIYALDRMDNLQVLDRRFSYPDDFDPQALFEDYFGVCIAYGTKLERVVVRIENDQRDYIETLPLHHSQRLIEENDEYGIYEFRIHPTIDFFRALLSFGTEAEVLEPEGFRACFVQEAHYLNTIYNPQ